ncbi:MAG: SAM-dependent methyltransferase [Gammaproteobacteria bacterium]|nr:SAM-dependent methyltransferase [Gammaproteobacteria bacterium]
MAMPDFCSSLSSYQAYIESEIGKQQLPAADPEAIKISFNLALTIIQRIQRQGAISFADFMQMALYEPGLGYYASGNQKFGAQGDFVTAPEISPLFAQTITQQFTQVFNQLEPNILELGAGSGVFAAEALLELERLKVLPEQYSILEVSAELQARQKTTIEQKAPHLISKVRWLERLPKEFNGVVFVNEVVDAIPVELYRFKNQQIEQAYVDYSNQGFEWHWQKSDKNNIDKPLINNQIIEDRTWANAWLDSLMASCNKALFILIDYGYSEDELYHFARKRGTLQHYYRHHKTDNPLALVGMQDITSSVDFTQLALTADRQKAQLLGYSTQASFLLGTGIEKIAQRRMEQTAASDTMQAMKVGHELKQLLMPDEMGETCKVLAFGKNFQQDLMGFALDNQLHKL